MIVIDERGVGMGVAQELRREGLRNIMEANRATEPLVREGEVGLRPNASKVDRFGRATLLIDDNKVAIPTAASWLDRFLYEVVAFPNISENDQVDSMTQLLAHFGHAIRVARRNHERSINS